MFSPYEKLTAKTHGTNDSLKRRVIGIKIAFRRNANKKEQPFRSLNRGKPISFVPAPGRAIRKISRHGVRNINLHAPSISNLAQVGIGLPETRDELLGGLFARTPAFFG